MKMDFPQVDLPTEVLAWTNVTEDILNIYKQSCRLQACIVAICTEGSVSGENRKSMPLLCRLLCSLCRTDQSHEEYW